MRAILATKQLTVSPGELFWRESPVPSPLCYDRNILLQDLLYHWKSEWDSANTAHELLPDPSLKHRKWSRFEICSLVSMDLLQLLYPDFTSDPQMYAAVEKWALQFTSQNHVRSPLLVIFLLLAVPIYCFGNQRECSPLNFLVYFPKKVPFPLPPRG
ncbi:hypothetical protein AVEN_132889-1 [Araneus ventricosus]|uniref:Uncharacterized protein n=1 Tax=Araneus ventricosus TaxID=182803 RepID=A0A4Y2VS46_ARAVE|nr:hypothetical protein AVEN_4411-1 [Araneus ventricosus]GBO27253.1 hypothetical protein AVEN_132889-1 [Araneus ventricosus]